MGLITAIGSGFKAVAAYFGWAKQRDAENNTPVQQANAESKAVQADRTQATKDVAAPDLTQLEKDVAE